MFGRLSGVAPSTHRSWYSLRYLHQDDPQRHETSFPKRLGIVNQYIRANFDASLFLSCGTLKSCALQVVDFAAPLQLVGALPFLPLDVRRRTFGIVP